MTDRNDRIQQAIDDIEGVSFDNRYDDSLQQIAAASLREVQAHRKVHGGEIVAAMKVLDIKLAELLRKKPQDSSTFESPGMPYHPETNG
jgi:hypothetical protein